MNEAIKAYEARKLNNGKLGVFWHTQGSGKSYSMVFLAQKIRRKFSGSPTIVILTDRDELNTQISDTFENCGILGKAKASQFIASNGDDLIDKLKGNPSFIFTLIQKFNKTDVEPIYPDHDIVIMSDEAHRSQYGIFADNMVRLLPTASRIGFTGTPLLSSDNITERTFGGCISVYDFKRAVEDGATVPLYYENRGEKILDVKDNPEITDRILDAMSRRIWMWISRTAGGGVRQRHPSLLTATAPPGIHRTGFCEPLLRFVDKRESHVCLPDQGDLCSHV